MAGKQLSREINYRRILQIPESLKLILQDFFVNSLALGFSQKNYLIARNNRNADGTD